ncbi:MAG: hypothetical protein MZV63_19365 [Marinilabiliales bacterium]|nr:hypothetical protein [Marinilabiliales bacterium]
MSELETGLFIEHQLKLAGHAGGELTASRRHRAYQFSLQGSAPRHRPPVRHGLPVCQLAVGTCHHPGVGGYSRSDLLSRRAVQVGYPDRGWLGPAEQPPPKPHRKSPPNPPTSTWLCPISIFPSIPANRR